MGDCSIEVGKDFKLDPKHQFGFKRMQLVGKTLEERHNSKFLSEHTLSDFIKALSMTNLKSDLEKVIVITTFLMSQNVSEILDHYGMKAKTC